LRESVLQYHGRFRRPFRPIVEGEVEFDARHRAPRPLIPQRPVRVRRRVVALRSELTLSHGRELAHEVRRVGVVGPDELPRAPRPADEPFVPRDLPCRGIAALRHAGDATHAGRGHAVAGSPATAAAGEATGVRCEGGAERASAERAAACRCGLLSLRDRRRKHEHAADGEAAEKDRAVSCGPKHRCAFRHFADAAGRLALVSVYYNRYDRQSFAVAAGSLPFELFASFPPMYRTNIRRFSGFLLRVAVVTLVASFSPAMSPNETLKAQSPATTPPGTKPAAAVPGKRIEFARMLPPETLLYVRAADAPLVRDEWWKTSLGRMAQDPQFKPTLDQSFTAVEKAFEPVKEKLGLSLAELLTLPRGEWGVALVGVDGAPPALLLLLETPDGDPSTATLLERGRAATTAAGWIEESESVGEVKLNIFRSNAGRAQRVLYLRREGVLVVATDLDVVKRVLKIWSGAGSADAPLATLAEQPAFVTLDRMIGKAEGAPAHLSFFVDPIALVRAATRENTAAQVGLAMLPALGLDGLTAVGGSLTFNRGAFETIAQGYLLLDVPRSGVVELIALQPTETEPEAWVQADVASYGTFTWDLERSYHKLRTIVDSFSGEGTFRSRVRDQLLKQTDLDLEADVLAELEGRISFLVAIEQPVSLQSRSQLVGLHLKNGKKFAPIFKKLTTKLQDKLTVKSYAGTVYYQDSTMRRNETEEQAAARPRTAFCLLDDCLLVADRASLIEKAIAATTNDKQRLASSLDYKLIAGKAKRYAGETGPGYLGFSRPDEELRFVHGLAFNDRVRTNMAAGGERNAFLKDFNQALIDRPLPPIEKLQKYFAPGGTILIDEPTGVRFLSFVLRRDEGR